MQDRVLPFSLALFLCSSMTHEDAARIHVGYGPVKYTWPCFAGDTFTKTFTVESIRNTSDGKHSVRMRVIDALLFPLFFYFCLQWWTDEYFST